MAGIEIGYSAIPEPTICGPVSEFEKLTLSSNCITMGGYGTVAGFLAAAFVYVGYFYAAPRVYAYGVTRGWWS